MIPQKLGEKFLFHSNLDVNQKHQSFPTILSRNFQKMEQQPIGVARYPIYNNFTIHLVR